MTTDQERAAFEAWAEDKHPFMFDSPLSDGARLARICALQAYQAATARQASELEALRLKLDTAYAVVIDLGGEVREPEIEEQRRLRADAVRYRSVRRGQKWSVIDGIGNDLRGEQLDVAIDAAKEQQA